MFTITDPDLGDQKSHAYDKKSEIMLSYEHRHVKYLKVLSFNRPALTIFMNIVMINFIKVIV